jgi:cephalosporin hydroxylase
MTPMGDILNRCGSDKNLPHCHTYAPVYESLFPNRQAVTAVLEIGIAGGGSIRAWHEIFPNALIVGLDHGPSTECPRGERLEIHQGNQGDRNAVLNCARNREFDLVIDDASHRLGDQLMCMWWLWPSLKKGGYYVVEEFDIQDGVGPDGNRASVGLLTGGRLVETPGPGGPEYLLVVKK